MKKVMIAFAAIAMASCAQAVTVTWGSGALYRAASEEGGWASWTAATDGAVATEMDVTMKVYLISADTWADDAVASMSQSELYSYVSGKTADYTAQNINSQSSRIAAATAKDTAFAASTDIYSIITAEYTDASYGDMYMAAAVADKSPASGTKSISNIFGGTSASHGVASWVGTGTVVPEPTSGLLMLLGMAGLALRRRRA